MPLISNNFAYLSYRWFANKISSRKEIILHEKSVSQSAFLETNFLPLAEILVQIQAATTCDWKCVSKETLQKQVSIR